MDKSGRLAFAGSARIWTLAGLFALFATPAFAQFEECQTPSNVPESLYFTIGGTADVDFGDLPEGVCNSIVKQGKAACRAQVKAAASCAKRSIKAAYEINAKQCAELETSEEREECKDAVKANRDDNLTGLNLSKDEGLEVCDDEFVGALTGDCLGEMPE